MDFPQSSGNLGILDLAQRPGTDGVREHTGTQDGERPPWFYMPLLWGPWITIKQKNKDSEHM